MSGQDWRWGRRGVNFRGVVYWCSLFGWLSGSAPWCLRCIRTSLLSQTAYSRLSLWYWVKRDHRAKLDTEPFIAFIAWWLAGSPALFCLLEDQSAGKWFSPQPFALWPQYQIWSLFFLSTVWVMWAGPALGPSPHGAWTWVSFLIWLVLPIQPGLKTAVPVAVKLVFPHFSGSEALPQKLVTVLQNLRISQRFKSWCLQRSSRDLSCIISKGGGR